MADVSQHCHHRNKLYLKNIWSEVKVTWHTAMYGDPYSESVLCIYPSKCTHTAVHTHTPCTHIRSRGQPFYAEASGEQLGVRCLAHGHLVMVLKVERALYIHSPPTTIPAGPRLELAIFWLWVRLFTIRPRLPHYITIEHSYFKITVIIT